MSCPVGLKTKFNAMKRAYRKGFGALRFLSFLDRTAASAQSMGRARRSAGRGLFRLFLTDIRGGTLTAFAIAVPALAVVGAAGIEFAEVSSTQNKLQAIVDGTALNAARQFGVDKSSATVTRAIAWADGLADPLRSRWTIQTTATTDPVSGTLTVVQDAQRTSLFRNLLPPGGFKVHVAGTAVSSSTYPLCVLALQMGSTTTAILDGSSSLTAPTCLVHSNGDLSTGGAAGVSAGLVRTSGRACGKISPAPITDAPA